MSSSVKIESEIRISTLKPTKKSVKLVQNSNDTFVLVKPLLPFTFAKLKKKITSFLVPQAQGYVKTRKVLFVIEEERDFYPRINEAWHGGTEKRQKVKWIKNKWHKTCEDIEDEREAFIDFGAVRLSHDVWNSWFRITTPSCSESIESTQLIALSRLHKQYENCISAILV